MPTPEGRNEAFKANTDPSGPSGEQVDISKGELTDRSWSVGDNINLAVGQGDLQADPLQMAVAYAAIGNGGTIVRPHVGLEVEDPAGRACRRSSRRRAARSRSTPPAARRSSTASATRR